MKTIVLGMLAAASCAVVPLVYGAGSDDGVPNNDGIIAVEKYPALVGHDKVVLFADQNGNLSSTEGLATAADLAAVAASNVVAQGIMSANREGYSTATNLMTEVANSLANTPIVFACVELASFTGALTFDVETSSCTIFAWEVEHDVTENKTVEENTFECTRITCGFAFTSNIDGLKPQVPYCEQIDGETKVTDSNEANWEYLNNALVETPIPVEGTPYTTSDGTTFTNFYEMHLWIPTDRVSGFFRVACKPEVIEGAGNVLDTVGVQGGATGVVTNGTVVLRLKGGYVMADGTVQLSILSADNAVNVTDEVQ